MRRIAERSYRIHRGEGATERTGALPSHERGVQGYGGRSLRRFTRRRWQTTYFASYTAYNGTDIGQQLLETEDFLRFTSSPMVGAAAANKGLALFPRRIGGRFAALSRSDRESNTISYSRIPIAGKNSSHARRLRGPGRSFNSATAARLLRPNQGWLVLTHGVGPMRTYSIGAILLDIEDPTRSSAGSREPLLSPASDEQNGYVPNVVYSCGALLHAGTLAIPYGIGDSAIGVATVELDELLASLVSTSH